MADLDEELMPGLLDEDAMPGLLDEDAMSSLLDEDAMPSLLDEDAMPSLLDEDAMPGLLDEDATEGQEQNFPTFPEDTSLEALHLSDLVNQLQQLMQSHMESVVASFPRVVESTMGCAICHDTLHAESSQPDNMILPPSFVELPCAHVFHTQCITSWVACSTTCPLCREDLYLTVIPSLYDAILYHSLWLDIYALLPRPGPEITTTTIITGTTRAGRSRVFEEGSRT
ncbi:hypothetical protein DFH09DRAFT_1114131 [Mycena vulgaris]|nr:hypothetical protein DFH09DRAFT_1114131 [Mycena vulgaris]